MMPGKAFNKIVLTTIIGVKSANNATAGKCNRPNITADTITAVWIVHTAFDLLNLWKPYSNSVRNNKRKSTSSMIPPYIIPVNRYITSIS